MSIIEGGVSGTLLGVGSQTPAPLHAAIYPMQYVNGGYYKAGGLSGTIAAALGANAEVFQFRYVTSASRICLIHRVEVSLALNLAATVAGFGALRLTAARSWTAAGSGGTRYTMTGDNCNLRTSMPASEVSDIGIASTAALTAGTKTLDTTDLAVTSFGILTGALTVQVGGTILPNTPLFIGDEEGKHPLVLANQEGFVIRSGIAMPATATFQLGVNVTWAELDAF